MLAAVVIIIAISALSKHEIHEKEIYTNIAWILYEHVSPFGEFTGLNFEYLTFCDRTSLFLEWEINKNWWGHFPYTILFIFPYIILLNKILLVLKDNITLKITLTCIIDIMFM